MAPVVDVRLRIATTLPKTENTTEDCQDRFSVTPRAFAISDGASDAAYSQVWSRILVETFTVAPPSELASVPWSQAWLDACRATWNAWEAEYRRRELPWFTIEKLRFGSFATFVGLVFPADRPGHWEAVACGDTCVFIVRSGVLVERFPIASSSLFNTHPQALSTKLGDAPVLATANGLAAGGDTFYLATDALAEWFLHDYERGGQPWLTLDSLRTDFHLESFVKRTREARELKDDDVGLMIIDAVDV